MKQWEVMYMNLKSKEEIKKIIQSSFISKDENEDLEHSTRMIMFRFLSEIERLSDENNMNKKELAKKLGTSASYITQLYRGSKLLNLPTLAKFQKIFNISFEIKAVSNIASDNTINYNSDCITEHISENQYIPEGFWIFRKFDPSYNIQEKSIDTPVNLTKKSLTA